MDSDFPYFGQVNSFNIALFNRKMKVLRFFYVLIYDELWVIGQKVLLLMPMELVKY